VADAARWSRARWAIRGRTLGRHQPGRVSKGRVACRERDRDGTQHRQCVLVFASGGVSSCLDRRQDGTRDMILKVETRLSMGFMKPFPLPFGSSGRARARPTWGDRSPSPTPTPVSASHTPNRHAFTYGTTRPRRRFEMWSLLLSKRAHSRTHGSVGESEFLRPTGILASRGIDRLPGRRHEPKAWAMRTDSSSFTRSFGRGLSIGKCSDPGVDV
jgi:hypothetical protein